MNYNIKHIDKTRLLLTMFLLLLPSFAWSQVDRKYIRQGNREYNKSKYAESEISYRRAIDKNRESADAVFNSGDALYKQNKFEDAGRQFAKNHDMNDDRIRKSASLYNLGNSLLMADMVKESIDAYKGSLRHNPDNMEAKYNLAYAQDLLKQQQEQQQNQQSRDQDKDQKQDKDDKSGGEQQQQQQQQEQQQDQEQQEQQQGISREDAERLLNALANDEKNVQEKVKLEKALKARTSTLKNW